jgi:hypothetical protein
MYRAAKNENGVIICIGMDENQSGNYPNGSSNEERLGVWCDWTFEEFPVLGVIEGAPECSFLLKENVEQDGMELRSEAEVLASPQE